MKDESGTRVRRKKENPFYPTEGGQFQPRSSEQGITRWQEGGKGSLLKVESLLQVEVNNYDLY